MLDSATSFSALFILTHKSQAWIRNYFCSSPAHLRDSLPDVRIQDDNDQRHEDKVNVANNVFQQQQLKRAQATKHIGMHILVLIEFQ